MSMEVEGWGKTIGELKTASYFGSYMYILELYILWTIMALQYFLQTGLPIVGLLDPLRLSLSLY